MESAVSPDAVEDEALVRAGDGDIRVALGVGLRTGERGNVCSCKASAPYSSSALQSLETHQVQLAQLLFHLESRPLHQHLVGAYKKGAEDTSGREATAAKGSEPKQQAGRTRGWVGRSA